MHSGGQSFGDAACNAAYNAARTGRQTCNNWEVWTELANCRGQLESDAKEQFHQIIVSSKTSASLARTHQHHWGLEATDHQTKYLCCQYHVEQGSRKRNTGIAMRHGCMFRWICEMNEHSAPSMKDKNIQHQLYEQDAVNLEASERDNPQRLPHLLRSSQRNMLQPH